MHQFYLTLHLHKDIDIAMVQEFNVVRCFSCETFQVDQVKKSTNKWTCKMCGEKQSLKQVYFTGTGKECRLNCQTLNMRRMEAESVKDAELADRSSEDENDEVVIPSISNSVTEFNNQQCVARDWGKFLEDEERDEAENGCGSFAVQFRGETNSRSANNKNRKRNNNQSKNSNITRSNITNIMASEPRSLQSSNRSNLLYGGGDKSTSVSNGAAKRSKLDGGRRNGDFRRQPEQPVLRDVPANRGMTKPQMTTKLVATTNNFGTKKSSVEDKTSQPQSKWSQFLSVEEDDDDDEDDTVGVFTFN